MGLKGLSSGAIELHILSHFVKKERVKIFVGASKIYVIDIWRSWKSAY